MTRSPLMSITLHRPWPYAIVNLGKPVENRIWNCSLEPGSLIAIHAGKKFDKQAAEWIRQSIGSEVPPDGTEHPTGIVAIASTVREIDAWLKQKSCAD